MAVSLLIIASDGLLIGSLRNLRDADPGFDRDNVLLLEVRGGTSQSPSALGLRLAAIRERLSALPGVTRVSSSWLQVFDPFADLSAFISVDGYTPKPDERVVARYNTISSEYFETLGIRIAVGRGFTDRDTHRSERVAVVNESFVRKYFNGQNAVGRSLTIGRGEPNQAPWRVVGDIKYNDLRRDVRPLFYVPILQLPRPVQSIEVRTAGIANTFALGPSLRRAMADAAPDWAVQNIRTVGEQVERPIATERLIAKLSAAFGVLALLLASIGLYGLLSHIVARRTPEIGLRIALGAGRSEVLTLVMRETTTVVLAGIFVGIALVVMCTRTVANLLYGLSRTEPITLLSAILVLMAVAAVATYLPARRAAHVDPLIALRTE